MQLRVGVGGTSVDIEGGQYVYEKNISRTNGLPEVICAPSCNKNTMVSICSITRSSRVKVNSMPLVWSGQKPCIEQSLVCVSIQGLMALAALEFYGTS